MHIRSLPYAKIEALRKEIVDNSTLITKEEGSEYIRMRVKVTAPQLKKLQILKANNPDIMTKLLDVREDGTEQEDEYAIILSPNPKWIQAVQLIRRIKKCALKEAKDIMDASGGAGGRWTVPITLREILSDKKLREVGKMIEENGLSSHVQIRRIT